MKAIPLALAASLLLPGLARAAHRYPGLEVERVRRLAHELEDAARHLHRAAEHRAHHRDRAERHAMRLLHDLERVSRHFHRQVERRHRPRDRYRSADDFARVWDAYHRALYALDGLHPDRHVRVDLRRVGRLVSSLGAYYGYRGAYRQPPRRHRHHHVPGRHASPPPGAGPGGACLHLSRRH